VSAQLNNVIDFGASKALAALQRIVQAEAASGESAKRTREDWREYGAELLEARAKMPNNKEFGRWITENGLDVAPATTPGVRSDAMWLAEQWLQFCLTDLHKTGLNRPDDIRKACRKAGYDWAITRKPDPAPPTPTTVGWTVAVQHHLGGMMPKGCASKTLINQKAKIEAELGHEIPKSVVLDSEEAREIAAAVRRRADKLNPTAALAAAERAHSEVQAEVATFPESAKAKFERLVAKDHAAMQVRYQYDLENGIEKGIKAKVDERFKLQQEYLNERQTKMNIEHGQLAIREKTLDQWMTKEEFKLVLGCLHPDRQPEDQRAKYDRAFQIFKRLEQHLEPDGRVLRGRGWS